MTNYAGSSDDIVFMTDYVSSAQNAYITGILDEYLPEINYSFDSCGYGCSDHASWYASGYPASMPFEATMNTMNPYLHTINDTLANMDTSGNHALNFAKMGLAYAIELANADTVEPPTGSVLENGVAHHDLTAQINEQIAYTMEIPAGSTGISFDMSGGTGDADLYVSQGSIPSDSSFDCRPYASGNNENCAMGAGSGTYHVVLKAFSTFGGVTLVGNYTESDTGGGDGDGDGAGNGGGDTIDETHTNVAVPFGEWTHFSQVIPAGFGSLTVTMSGGTGDADLFVNFGSESSTSNWDCRPFSAGNNEDCSFTNPAAGTWHIDLNGYSSATGITLNWTATE
ncbi:MAG: pre-peptidase C-terminal domain-containing protein [Algicola sp.]|nr:pre-peptidase C-terminal domain-containing protein [Algicola sp.]